MGRGDGLVPDGDHLPAAGHPDVLLLLPRHHRALEVDQEHDGADEHQRRPRPRRARHRQRGRGRQPPRRGHGGAPGDQPLPGQALHHADLLPAQPSLGEAIR